MKLSTGLVLLGLFVVHCKGACTTPKTFQTYSSSDVFMSSEAIFIVEFDMTCDASEQFPAIHAFVGGQLLPLARSVGGNRYQLSWSLPHKEAVVGTQSINFYNEEESTAIRKSLRYNEEIKAKPLFTVQYEYKGTQAWNWFAPSFLAVVVSVLVWWLAYNTKTKLQE
ncbi:hypothetical protein EMCRGX_G000186 [Ephydatia muelleri]|eukprot:Em0001g92a